MDLVQATFSFDLDTLPTTAQIQKCILLEDDWHRLQYESSLKTWQIRDEYTKKSFFILSHEFMLALKRMTTDLNINKIIELSCGIGWFTYWIRKYGIEVLECVDNKSWKYETVAQYLDCVKTADSISYVESHPEVELFIIAWPYMDDMAFRIWEALKKDQYLLYIGESDGGCTADEKFFAVTEKYEVKGKWFEKSFVSFYGIHDYPTLYRKEDNCGASVACDHAK